MVDNQDFASFASEVIHNIADDIEDQDEECQYDVDLNGNILSIQTESGTYVVNTQTAIKEIWLSSPISGPYHFSYQDTKWLDRNGKDLMKILSSELNLEI